MIAGRNDSLLVSCDEEDDAAAGYGHAGGFFIVQHKLR